MSNNIRVSKKHGVNPTIPVCFWCGEQKNEIALLGELPGDKEAPRTAVINYEPCDKCAEMFSKGIHIVEVTTERNDCPEFNKGLYPTGRNVVVKKEFITTNFNKDFAEQVLNAGKLLMDIAEFQKLVDAFEGKEEKGEK